MKLKHLLSAALIAATLFNFSSCKEDDDEINWDYENAISIKNIGTKYNSKSITVEELQGVAISDTTLTISARYTGVSGQEIKFDVEYGVVGETLQRIENVSSATLILDKPFEEYTLHLVYWGEDEDGNVSEKSDVVEVNFYYISNLDLKLTRGFGKGEISTTIKWKLGHNSDGKYVACSKEELESLKKKNIGITVEITSDEAKYTAAPIELTNVDSLFVKKDVDNGIILTQKYVRGTINGKEETLYEEAYKYNFKVTVKIPVGDKFIEKSGSITSILVDGDAYAIDDEFNIYRTIKIGDDIWTIDNYRGTKVEYGLPSNAEYADYGFYLYWDIDEYSNLNSTNINNKILNGYHVSTKADWENMESYLGIEYPNNRIIEGYPNLHESLIYGVQDLLEILKCDDITKYANCFASNAPWHVFDSDYNTPDIEALSKYPFRFNVHYVGISSDLILDLDYSEVGEIAFFLVSGGYNRIVSKKYQSICKYRDYSSNSVRLVKDRK